MKRIQYFLLALSLSVIVAIVADVSPAPPRLTILLHGSPVENLTVTEIPSRESLQTDGSGTITLRKESANDFAVLVPHKPGFQRQVSFPERGHKTVDLSGRYIRTTTVWYRFGVLRCEEHSEQYDLTDEEVAALEAGIISQEELHRAILSESPPNLTAQ